MLYKKIVNSSIIIIQIIFIIIDILTFIYSIWTVLAIKLLYYVYFWLILIICLFFILYLFCENYYNNIIMFAGLSYFVCSVFIFINFISLSINLVNYLQYWKNCPFTISEFYEQLNIERICQLYNINNNSRYSYQYVCSYDSSKDFHFDLSKKIENNKVICVKGELIEDNKIINLFYNKYKNIYYCSRTNRPNSFKYAKDKDCKKINYIMMILIYIFFCFKVIFYPIVFISVIHLQMIAIIRENNGHYFLGNIFRNNNQMEDNSTRESENVDKSDIFIKQNTRNIIIENKNEFSIEQNIKNYIISKDKNVNINLEEINIEIINSENNQINKRENDMPN